jgi:hypothetical protein
MTQDQPRFEVLPRDITTYRIGNNGLRRLHDLPAGAGGDRRQAVYLTRPL